MNHFDWEIVNENSIYHTKAMSYIKQKYEVAAPMFVSYKASAYGNHFEVSYLNNQEVFSKAYLSYVDSEDTF